jgi:hypothetical protein
MSVNYDGDFSTPIAIGQPRVKYPVTNLSSLFFVTQKYVQLATAYAGPRYGMKHPLYPSASFCEEINFNDKGGGLVEYEWRFSTSGASYIESTIESVTFVGMRFRRVPFKEAYLEPSGTSANPTMTRQERTLYAYDVVVREPFTESVECTTTIEYRNIFEGTGSASAQRFTKAELEGQSSVNYGGVNASVTFDEDVLVLNINGVETRISSNNGYYYIPRPSTKQSTYYVGAFPIETPMIVRDDNSTKIAEAIESAYEAQKLPLSVGYTGGAQDYRTQGVTKFVSETSSPSKEEYEALIGNSTMIVKPTEVEQFAGSIYKITNVRTEYR